MVHNYRKLANDIIIQAAKDYRKALHCIKNNPRNQGSIAVIKDCENFFLSGWFQILTDIDGHYLIDKIKKGV